RTRHRLFETAMFLMAYTKSILQQERFQCDDSWKGRNRCIDLGLAWIGARFLAKSHCIYGKGWICMLCPPDRWFTNYPYIETLERILYLRIQQRRYFETEIFCVGFLVRDGLHNQMLDFLENERLDSGILLSL